jgi:hypothetical protein
MFFKNEDNKKEIYDMPPAPMPALSPEEKARQERRFHLTLVLVIFQSLVIVALLLAIVYKMVKIGANL